MPKKKRGKAKILHGWVWEDRVDATDTITIGPLKPSDFNAIPQNTMQCVLAKAVNRQRRVNGRAVAAVWIGATVVDVCFKDEPTILRRYFLSPDDVQRVRTFDEYPEMVKKVGKWNRNVTITLIPPPPNKRLGAGQLRQGKKRGSGNGNRRTPLRHLFAEEG